MAASTFFLKKGDTSPAIICLLEDAVGAVDLTDCSVKVRWSRLDIVSPVEERVAAVQYPTEQSDPAKKGLVTYQWALDGSDTQEVGWFNLEWVVTLPSGAQVTFPRGGGIEPFNQLCVQEAVV